MYEMYGFFIINVSFTSHASVRTYTKTSVLLLFVEPHTNDGTAVEKKLPDIAKLNDMMARLSHLSHLLYSKYVNS